ncbi:MAG: peptide-methionine (R)-S-oxide reductase MsrB [Phenylobacterium sp.]|uniref:peptide-methionine (R)-S-oxide reductase MsrB n=1 Tax=Phenylobacterium sp. TaxID=1871053 RepID=UPI0008B1EB1C|nr:peptide-methionine (R)-S-oxide reductase MsrB [Phenylobacterium sp.]MBA4792772.1 peptide-methionine (R)-S-oxide reductase MsrB [Phenylobacterium sp.]OHB37480.1 MAG: peptide-methionine (R)-S-oxide reductase [Phenylobacterium sp. RIFCSPHIGHO2_01_FULL_70_10]
MNAIHALHRRGFLLSATALAACSGAAPEAEAADAYAASPWRKLSDAEWKQRLSPAAFQVLRHEATERAGTSPLNREKRNGTYVCAGCELPLFKSDWKYDSGTGWPSFYTAIKGALGTKTDYKIGVPRTEYHCARCLGHQGHVFRDGPRPTGLRYCNNGVALKFVPA